MKKKSIKFGIIIIVMLLLITSCKDASNTNNSQSNNNQNNSSGQSSNNGDENTGSSDDPVALIQASWESSRHADTYVLDNNGINIACAQCHSPSNWVPSMDDVPESCLVCKFEISEPEPLVEEHEWENIPCMTCHKLDDDGIAQPEIYYLEIAAIEEYADVETSTELCQKCHQATNDVGHLGIQVAGAHDGYNCDDCHDPHSNDATCASGECHSTFRMESEPIAGHDDDHQLVTCAACHDGDALPIGKNDENYWVTLSENNAESAFYSHNIVLDVACDRCHYPDNPWDLSGAVNQP